MDDEKGQTCLSPSRGNEPGRRYTGNSLMADGLPLVVDLFCGAGGFSLGFHAAGCRILAAADVDVEAAATYRRNFGLLQPGHEPHVPENGALEEIDLDTV